MARRSRRSFLNQAVSPGFGSVLLAIECGDAPLRDDFRRRVIRLHLKLGAWADCGREAPSIMRDLVVCAVNQLSIDPGLAVLFPASHHDSLRDFVIVVDAL
jgi:hypothetical protein